MGYLDNSSNTVDAILTKKGRELLSKGNFNITHFALADDEIDYALYNINHPDGTQFAGQAIENMPLLEAFPDESIMMRHKLVTLDTWMWMLTGTPAAQSPLDAHGLAKLCVPNNVTPSKMRFKDAVMYPVSKFKWMAKPNAQDVVHKTLQPAIRFTKEQCLDLPEVTYVDREAPLTLQQKHYYKEVIEILHVFKKLNKNWVSKKTIKKKN